MIVRNNYNECITNLACSIRKYFGLDYKHNSLNSIDNILDEYKPKNVVVILFDGMGSNILKRCLDDQDFFIKNMMQEITSVFPATTTAATTSIRTGLNPVEHGWLGWNMYIKPIDKVITLFRECEKGSESISDEFLNMKDKLSVKTIVKEINEKGDCSGIELFPFDVDGTTRYNGLDDMLNIILDECNKDGRKYIYAYDDEPDHTMHEVGPDNWKSKELIVERNYKVGKLCEQLKDTLVLVIADHGHIKCDNIFLKEYPEFMNMLKCTTSLEQRTVSFRVKDEFKDKFEDEFNKLFGKYFKLFKSEEVISSKLFGEGEEHSLFRDALGDYIAISYSSNKCLVSEGDDILFSQHAGYTDDEIYVPLIKVLK